MNNTTKDRCLLGNTLVRLVDSPFLLSLSLSVRQHPWFNRNSCLWDRVGDQLGVMEPRRSMECSRSERMSKALLFAQSRKITQWSQSRWCRFDLSPQECINQPSFVAGFKRAAPLVLRSHRLSHHTVATTATTTTTETHVDSNGHLHLQHRRGHLVQLTERCPRLLNLSFPN